MALHFESGYSGDIVKLTLIDDCNLVLFHFEFDRLQATDLVDLLNDENPDGVVAVQQWLIHVIKDYRGTVFVIGDGKPFSRCEVLLNKDQTQDLASSLRMHIIASEESTRPKDILPSLDDSISGWTPEKEKQMYGGQDDLDDRDEDDHSEDWKKA